MSRNRSERTLQNTENSPKVFLGKAPYVPPAPEIVPRWPATALVGPAGRKPLRRPCPFPVTLSVFHDGAGPAREGPGKDLRPRGGA